MCYQVQYDSSGASNVIYPAYETWVYMSAPGDSLRTMVRSLLTDGERQAVKDSDEMDANTKSSHLSRVKRKIERMRQDAADLKEHRPGLYDGLYEAVCKQTVEQRLQALERRVDDLEERTDNTSKTNTDS